MSKVMSLVLFCLAFQCTAQEKACNTLNALNWLTGNWHSENSKLKFSESWSRISEKTFEGYGQTYSIVKNKVVSAESLRLVEMSGEVFYLAKVASNTLPTAFKLTRCDADSAVFENSRHDFPNKIRYQLNKDKNISVFVSGEDGKGFSIEFIGKNGNAGDE
ncbi:hypothetical protein PRUB_a0606 [Pseudoalteromonas rubra]|uniref:DUF6265 domain-containing protein n=1 Tax=Pseudoalteromonas rubra TaxID=43658 RepID=A0A8T0C5W1_9GAMM|nr:DUF6265 family protein [Pseudoalteromonas rubra]KAF7786134.1 hypothetical protein PRUB_a0606 [Pseudoalteromonas rubra]